MKLLLHSRFLLLFALCMALCACQKDLLEPNAEADDKSKIAYKQEDLATIDLGNGQKERGAYIDGDIFVSESQLAALQNDSQAPQSKLRVWKHRINTCKGPFVSWKNKWHRGKKIIYIYINRSGRDSPSKIRSRRAMRIAVDAFNEIGTGIYFQIVHYYPKKHWRSTITLYHHYFKGKREYNKYIPSRITGRGAYPDKGRVGEHILINTYYNRNIGLYDAKKNIFYKWPEDSAKRLASILFHELAHTLGFWHSDWRTRRSCGDTKKEIRWEKWLGRTELILNRKNDGRDPYSIMASCSRTGLNYLYLSEKDKRMFRAVYPRKWKQRGCK